MTKDQDLHGYFQAKRLIQIYWAIELTLVLVCIQRLYLGHFFQAFLTVAVGAILIGVYRLAKQKRVLAAATFLLSILTIFVTYFMWSNAGIYDEVLLAYPCILIMAAMMGDKKLFIGLIVFMSISVALNGISNHQAWYVNETVSVNVDSAILVLLIIWLISYTIWVMSSDFNALLNKLSHENTAVVNSKKKIEKLLHHDILTGLPNRMMAQEIFTHSLSKARRTDTGVCLMFIDLDNFKLINDGLGHQAGDALLIELSQRFKECVRDTDYVCRFAGDEFVIILESVKTDTQLARIAQSITASIQAPFYYQSNEIMCSCSIGISVTPNDALDFDTMVQNADTAMYHSKSIGGNSFHFFDPVMDNQNHDYLNVVADLRKALKEDQFVLHFQPQFDLISNKIMGAEALIRWNHPQKGLIFPDFFIPQAEKSGLIIEIGEWVLASACQTCKTWVDLGFEDFSMAVNVSSQQFKRGNLSNTVETLLTKYDLAANHLEIEMTESLLIENSNELKETVRYLNNLGVTFSIDDFGTGYSNLSYLKEFEIEVLKIDRSFMKDIEQNSKNRALVSAIIQMAKSLSLKTVAEGIENKEIAAMLSQLECDYGQGYHWSKPICEAEFAQYYGDYMANEEAINLASAG